jgi:cell division protein FtsI (penicillin-binding protein 3)
VTDGRPPRSRASTRIGQARGWHPRGRTVGEAVDDAPRPRLRLVDEGHQPAPRKANDRSATKSKATSRTAATSSSPGPGGGPARDGGLAAAPAPRGGRRPRRAATTTARPARPTVANTGARLRQSTAIVLALFAVLGLRLVVFQFTDASAYAAQGLIDRLRPVDLPAPRGSIVDRNGAVLASSVEARYVFADPSRVEDSRAAAEALSPVLGVPVSELLPKLVPHRRDDLSEVLFEYLARGVPPATAERVLELGLAGIGVDRDETRVVPGHDLAANLIGFTGRDLQGLAGLEASYDELLRGVNGRRSFEIGQQEANLDHEIPGGYEEEIPARPGRSLQLTIDSDLQFEVQGILGEAMARAGASLGAAVVLDVTTGEVLAQASYPFYDAANPLTTTEQAWGDVATSWAVDPGSVHKAVVFAACLQEGVITPDTTLPLPMTITKGSNTFRDTHWHPPMAQFTMPGILAWSSNVGTITLADQLGAEKLYAYQRAFGLGDPIGTGLPGEAAGLVQPPENWSEEAHGTIPIGLGVSATPLQMAAVYAAIANGGVYIRPTLVKAVIDADGTVTPTAAPPTRRVISAENATALRSMLEAVVTAPDATGRTAAIDDYRVAGKTGTGMVVVDGEYDHNSEVGSFIGMAPADAPRYVVAVFAKTAGGSGGVVAGPAFAKIMEQTLLHFRVAPTGSPAPEFTIYQQ